jgi:hypothetical protein
MQNIFCLYMYIYIFFLFLGLLIEPVLNRLLYVFKDRWSQFFFFFSKCIAIVLQNNQTEQEICYIWHYIVQIHIQYWSVDGKYRIYLTRLRNGVKDELLASLSPRFALSQINSIFTVNRPILYLSCNPRCPKK